MTINSDIIQDFESIGDSCEFGFVQKYFGYQPISLLRWAGCSLDGLARALEANFDGLFNPDDLLSAGKGSIKDRKYEIYYHSKLRFDAAGLCQDAENIANYQRLRRDVHFRLRLFNETLEARDKIFVYKSTRKLYMGDVLRIKAALDLHGPQRLLWVIAASNGFPAGAMERVASGVKIASIAALAPNAHQDRIDAGAWLSVCAQARRSDWGDAYAIRPSGRPAATGRVAGPEFPPPADTGWTRLMKHMFALSLPATATG